MDETILLYGATGYSGRLIAAEAARARDAMAGPGWRGRLILAGRDRRKLSLLARQYGMESRAFVLDDLDAVRRGLADVDVLVNAAGPFALTAERLAKSAVEAGAHYVDINGEVDVFLRLDDLHRQAGKRHCAVVCGAGCTAAASDLLLDYALAKLAMDRGLSATKELGAVRIAMSRPAGFSRGSAQTAWRSLREQVTVVRRATPSPRERDPRRALKLVHEPVGKLERTFDFAPGLGAGAKPKPDLRIASATDLVDTLTARKTLERRGWMPQAIESYVDMGAAGRAAYQLGALLAPVAAIPLVRGLASAQIDMLLPEPTPEELGRDRHVVLLEIEDAYRTRVIDWRLETPNPYQLTAQTAVAVAAVLARAPKGAPGALQGLVTPAAILIQVGDDSAVVQNALRDCSVVERRTQ